MRKLALLVASLMLALGGAGLAYAGPPEHAQGKGPGHGQGHGKPQCDAEAPNHTPNHPACQDEGEEPAEPDCEAEPDHPDCQEPEPPAPADCPPATGAVSGVVQQVSDGVRDGGGDPIADGVDQLNCAVIVAIEDALLGGDDGNGDDGNGNGNGDDGNGDDGNGNGNGDDGDGAECPPAEGTISGQFQELIDQGRGQGMPEELASGFETLNCQGTVALEDALGI